MFKQINQMLQIDDFLGIDSNIDIVKGVNKYPETIKEAYRQAKRKIMSKKSDY